MPNAQLMTGGGLTYNSKQDNGESEQQVTKKEHSSISWDGT